MKPVNISIYNLNAVSSPAIGAARPLKEKGEDSLPVSTHAPGDEVLVDLTSKAPVLTEIPQKIEVPPPAVKAPSADGSQKAAPASPVVLFQEEPPVLVQDGAAEYSPPPQSALATVQLGMVLDRVAGEKKEYGLSMQPPCEGKSVCTLKEKVAGELNCELPADYEAFLSKTNGLDHNGLVFYGSEPCQICGFDDRQLDGIVEANQGRRDMEVLKNYLVVGESEDALFAYHPQSSRYVALDSSSLDEGESFDSFRQMLRSALDASA
jgi:hypothetical protein